MLGFRINKGINKKEFNDKYNVNIENIFNYKNLVLNKVLEEDNNYLKVREEYFYVLDEVLMNLIEQL